jgi:hypothetical protein
MLKNKVWMLINSGGGLNFRFLDRLVSTLEEKKHHEVKLKEGLKDLATKRMELHNSLASSWPKQVSSSLIQGIILVLPDESICTVIQVFSLPCFTLNQRVKVHKLYNN